MASSKTWKSWRLISADFITYILFLFILWPHPPNQLCSAVNQGVEKPWWHRFHLLWGLKFSTSKRLFKAMKLLLWSGLIAALPAAPFLCSCRWLKCQDYLLPIVIWLPGNLWFGSDSQLSGLPGPTPRWGLTSHSRLWTLFVALHSPTALSAAQISSSAAIKRARSARAFPNRSNNLAFPAHHPPSVIFGHPK